MTKVEVDTLEAKSALLEAYYAFPEKQRKRILLPNKYIDLFGVIVGLLKLLIYSENSYDSKSMIDYYFSSVDQGILTGHCLL